MTRVRHTSKDIDLIARMMRAEAEGEGRLGMLMVGNVIVNRAVADCLDFEKCETSKKSSTKFKGETSPLKPYKKEICFTNLQEK